MNLLIVTSDTRETQQLSELVVVDGVFSQVVNDATQAVAIARENSPLVLIVDSQMEGMEYALLYEELQQVCPDAFMILTGPNRHLDNMSQLAQTDVVFDYFITQPLLEPRRLSLAVQRALQISNLWGQLTTEERQAIQQESQQPFQDIDILLVLPDSQQIEQLREILKQAGFQPRAVQSASVALSTVEELPPAIIVIDKDMQDVGQPLYRQLRLHSPNSTVILACNQSDTTDTFQLVKEREVFDYFVVKPLLDIQRLPLIVFRAIGMARLQAPLVQKGEQELFRLSLTDDRNAHLKEMIAAYRARVKALTEDFEQMGARPETFKNELEKLARLPETFKNELEKLKVSPEHFKNELETMTAIAQRFQNELEKSGGSSESLQSLLTQMTKEVNHILQIPVSSELQNLGNTLDNFQQQVQRQQTNMFHQLQRSKIYLANSLQLPVNRQQVLESLMNRMGQFQNALETMGKRSEAFQNMLETMDSLLKPLVQDQRSLLEKELKNISQTAQEFQKQTMASLEVLKTKSNTQDLANVPTEATAPQIRSSDLAHLDAWKADYQQQMQGEWQQALSALPQKFQNELEKMGQSLYQFQNELEKMGQRSEPFENTLEHMDSWQTQLKNALECMEKLPPQFQNELEKMGAPLEKFQNELEHMANLPQKFQNELEKMGKLPVTLKNELERLRQLPEAFQNELEKMGQIPSRFQNELETLVKSIKEEMENLNGRLQPKAIGDLTDQFQQQTQETQQVLSTFAQQQNQTIEQFINTHTPRDSPHRTDLSAIHDMITRYKARMATLQDQWQTMEPAQRQAEMNQIMESLKRDLRQATTVAQNQLTTSVEVLGQHHLDALLKQLEDGVSEATESALNCSDTFTPVIQPMISQHVTYEFNRFEQVALPRILRQFERRMEKAIEHPELIKTFQQASQQLSKQLLKQVQHLEAVTKGESVNASEDLEIEKETHRVLVVDDAHFMRVLIENLLRENGYEVLTAANGQEALGIAKQEKPQLILMDITMPTMDGLQAIRYLKQDRDTAHIPVIVVSGTLTQEMTQAVLQEGVFDCLQKSVVMNKGLNQQLLDQMIQALRRKKTVNIIRRSRD